MQVRVPKLAQECVDPLMEPRIGTLNAIGFGTKPLQKPKRMELSALVLGLLTHENKMRTLRTRVKRRGWLRPRHYMLRMGGSDVRSRSFVQRLFRNQNPVEVFADAPAPNFAPDWNMPPTAPMLVAIRSVEGKRVPRMMKWGLVPAWAKDDKLQYSTFNARSEEFTAKPAFRDAWKRGRRCLVVTDGFYEWKKLDPKGKKKQAYAISMRDDGEMVMAGLWSNWKSRTSGEEIPTCTVLTCDPNKSMAELHDRMPVILAESDWPAWLGEEPATEQELLALLKPCPDEVLKSWAVDNRVGNVRNQGPEFARPIEPALA